MADETTTAATTTDIFQQQEKTIKLLYDVFQNQLNQAQQPVYVQSAQPTEQPQKAPNYFLWAALALAAFLIAKKMRVF